MLQNTWALRGIVDRSSITLFRFNLLQSMKLFGGVGECGYFFGCDYRESQRALSSAQLRNSPALGSLHRGLPANPVWPRPVGGVLLGLGALQFMLLAQYIRIWPNVASCAFRA